MCCLTAGFPVSAVSAVCFEGCRLSRSVSTPSVPVSTLAGVISWISGVADLLFDTQCTFSTLLPSGFSALSVGLDTLGTPSDPPADGFDPLGPPNRFSTLLPARDTLSDPTPVSASFLKVRLARLSPVLLFRSAQSYILGSGGVGVSTLPPPAIRARGGVECG